MTPKEFIEAVRNVPPNSFVFEKIAKEKLKNFGGEVTVTLERYYPEVPELSWDEESNNNFFGDLIELKLLRHRYLAGIYLNDQIIKYNIQSSNYFGFGTNNEGDILAFQYVEENIVRIIAFDNLFPEEFEVIFLGPLDTFQKIILILIELEKASYFFSGYFPIVIIKSYIEYAGRIAGMETENQLNNLQVLSGFIVPLNWDKDLR